MFEAEVRALPAVSLHITRVAREPGHERWSLYCTLAAGEVDCRAWQEDRSISLGSTERSCFFEGFTTLGVFLELSAFFGLDTALFFVVFFTATF